MPVCISASGLWLNLGSKTELEITSKRDFRCGKKHCSCFIYLIEVFWFYKKEMLESSMILFWKRKGPMILWHKLMHEIKSILCESNDSIIIYYSVAWLYCLSFTFTSALLPPLVTNCYSAGLCSCCWCCSMLLCCNSVTSSNLSDTHIYTDTCVPKQIQSLEFYADM